jgi:hypothetical protein
MQKITNQRLLGLGAASIVCSYLSMVILLLLSGMPRLFVSKIDNSSIDPQTLSAAARYALAMTPNALMSRVAFWPMLIIFFRRVKSSSWTPGIELIPLFMFSNALLLFHAFIEQHSVAITAPSSSYSTLFNYLLSFTLFAWAGLPFLKRTKPETPDARHANSDIEL